MPEDNKNSRWKVIAGGVLVLAVVFAAWWSGKNPADAYVDSPAICAHCHVESTVKVGETPAQEEWPRTCPSCNHKALYLAGTCSACGKNFPLKAPDGERFGYPEQCPHCRNSRTRGT